MENEDLPKYQINTFKKSPTDAFFRDIDERLNEIEGIVFKGKKKTDPTRAQKILLMQELGIIEHLYTLNISQKSISHLLEALINFNYTNIERDLVQRNSPAADIKTVTNFEYVVNIFNNLNLKELEEKADEKLDQLRKLKT